MDLMDLDGFDGFVWIWIYLMDLDGFDGFGWI